MNAAIAGADARVQGGEWPRGSGAHAVGFAYAAALPIPRAAQPQKTYQYFPDGAHWKHIRRDGDEVTFGYDAANRPATATPAGLYRVDGLPPPVWAVAVVRCGWPSAKLAAAVLAVGIGL